MAMASLIASKSPVAVTSTKHNLVYSRDHSVDEGLNYMVRTIFCLSKEHISSGVVILYHTVQLLTGEDNDKFDT